MPVLLDAQTRKLWLDHNTNYDECFAAIARSDVIKGEGLEIVHVSNQVNSIRNQGIQCVLPKADFEKLQFAKGLGRFFKPQAEEQKQIESKATLKEHIQ